MYSCYGTTRIYKEKLRVVNSAFLSFYLNLTSFKVWIVRHHGMFASRGLKHSLSKCNTAVELYYWYGAWVVGLMRYKESVEEYYESGRIRNCYSIFQWEQCRIRGNLNFLSLYISFFVRMGILTRKKYSTA